MSISSSAQSDTLSAAEFRAAVDAMRDVDWARLMKKAQLLMPGTGMSARDLLHEALVRAMEENAGRNCPRTVNPAVFLGNAMRSIASHAREEWAREMPTGTVEEDERDLIADTLDEGPSPEALAISRLDHGRVIARIQEMFENDSMALAVVIGDMEGWSPEQIREMEPMSDKEYVAARKRVRRALLREFAEGPTYD